MSRVSLLPDSVRSRYALKLLGVALVIVLVITALTTVTVLQVSDRVRDNQLQSVETNAELEADSVRVTTSIPDDATLVSDAETLAVVLRSPLENAVTHGESRVTVSVDSTESGCTIEICDDGPGIPAAELNSLAAGRETALQHGRGLGLWELKWGVDKLDGCLSFDTDDGTAVTIQLPDLDPA